MSMQKLVCPHCNKEIRTVAVNDNIRMSTTHGTCSKCRKPYAWYGDHGKLIIIKE